MLKYKTAVYICIVDCCIRVFCISYSQCVNPFQEYMLQWMYMDSVQRSVCVMMIMLVSWKVSLLSQLLPRPLVRNFLPVLKS